MKYNVKLIGTWTLKDDSTKDFEAKKQFRADSVPELKEKFEFYLTDEAFREGYKSVIGTIESVTFTEIKILASDRPFSGVFVNTEDVEIDLNS